MSLEVPSRRDLIEKSQHKTLIIFSIDTKSISIYNILFLMTNVLIE